MRYAMIDNGVVTNIVIISQHQEHEFSNIVLVDNRPVAIGDEYHDNGFWRDGMKILTSEESLQQETDELLNLLGNAAELEYMNAMEEIENV